jgi:hypothetical protein
MDSSILYTVAWFGLALVDIFAGKEKGISAGLLIIPSLIAAPLVYLYVLAIPPPKADQKR